MPDISDIVIPGLIRPLGSPEIIRLHVFANASKATYDAAAYLTVFTKTESSFHLVLAKSKIVPFKPMAIPRLELSAALLALDCVIKFNPL